MPMIVEHLFLSLTNQLLGSLNVAGLAFFGARNLDWAFRVLTSAIY